METKKEILSYIQNVSTFLLGIFLIFFPLVFATTTTNPIILPKQILLYTAVLILLLLLGISMVIERVVRFRKTYFDIPIILFTFVIFLSVAFSVNRMDSIMVFAPFLFGVILYFLIVNTAKDKNSLLFLLSCLTTGGVMLSIFSILSFLKIYILPFPTTHSQSFSLLGSLLDQSIYLVLTGTFAIFYTIKLLTKKKANYYSFESTEVAEGRTTHAALFGMSSIIIMAAVAISIYLLVTVEKPPILPFETSFQTAVSEIAFDTGRVTQGFLLGSGFGTYAVDFARWKPASFNQNQALWNLTFFRSSSFAMDLLATTGVLGLGSFMLILFSVLKEIRKNIKNYLSFPLLIIFIALVFLPVNFIIQIMLFIILALFAAIQGLRKENNKFFDLELQLVTLKKGLISLDSHEKNDRKEKSVIFPSLFMLLFLVFVGFFGFFGFKYVTADLVFQKSFLSAQQNNGSLTYQQQSEAISAFPFRDGFYRSFSQTNLALADSLASSQPKNTPISSEIQRQIITLIQQSINSARRATTLAPKTYLNWQNLSSIYRSLIGFGQNAEGFAITTAQASIALDPSNPQQYINLGGIYYQLQQWENAQAQFQFAVNLKPDYANSYYNLGHVLEQKQDLESALAQYERVKTLVASNPQSFTQIEKEIEDLKNRIATNSKSTLEAPSSQTLNLNTPPAQLPKQTPQVKIPAPDVATTSSR